jgi:hypothetical protein
MVVKLEVIKVGGTTCTSQEALQRFFDRLTGDMPVITRPTQNAKQRLPSDREADEILRRAGI